MAKILNPIDDIRNRILEAIKQKGGYCPCLIAKTPDTLCPCRDFRENDKCHCGLYVEEI